MPCGSLNIDLRTDNHFLPSSLGGFCATNSFFHLPSFSTHFWYLFLGLLTTLFFAFIDMITVDNAFLASSVNLSHGNENSLTLLFTKVCFTFLSSSLLSTAFKELR